MVAFVSMELGCVGVLQMHFALCFSRFNGRIVPVGSLSNKGAAVETKLGIIEITREKKQAKVCF